MSRRPLFSTAHHRVLAALLGLSGLFVSTPSLAYHYPWDQGHDTVKPNQPEEPGTPKQAPCDTCNSPNADRSPAYASTGHAIWSETDVVLRGRPYLGVTRTYNSNDPVDGLFGNGWTTDIDVSLYPATRETTQMRIFKAPNGKRFEYLKQADGTFKTPASRFETITEAAGAVSMTMLDGTRYVFANDGHLTDRYDPNGNHVHITGDSSGRPIELADDNGRKLSITYNGSGRISSITDHASRAWAYDYDSLGNLVSVTDPLSGSRQYSYQSYKPTGDGNTYSQLTKVVDPSGVVAVAYTYSGSKVATYTEGANTFTYTRTSTNTTTSGTVTKRDAMGATTSFTYGDLGLVTRDVDALGGVTTYTYDSNGRITKTVDALNRSWLSTYDSLGRVTTRSNPLSQTSTIAYSGNDPRPVTLTSPSGRVVTLGYDSRGNLLSSKDPAGAITRMAYSAKGDATTITNALNQATSIGYAATGLPVSVTDALNRKSTLSYDDLGRVATSTNPAGEATSYTYDALDRVTTVTDPLNQVTSFTYDAAGRLTSVTDAKGSKTQYEYDSYGRRSAEVAPDGRRTTYAYRADNLLSTLTWPDNTTISYLYDNNKRVTRETAGTEVINYTYNAVNQLLSATGPGGTVSYTYDNAGRVATETSGGKTNTITRNAEGERTQLVALGNTQTYTRDTRGLVTRIAATPGNFDFAFDALGRRTKLSYPNGSTASYAFDAAGQLTDLTHAGVFNAPYAHTFDAAGRIIRISGDGPDWSYSYDALGRLTQAIQGGDTYTYTLDAVGNILDGGRAHDVNHRLTSDANKTYSYDQRGNLTLEQDRNTGARTVYTWNVKNQLLKVEFFANATAASLSRTLNYTYDPLGRRASKVDNGVIQKFVYDGEDLVGALDSGTAIVVSNVFSGSIDEPLVSTSGGTTKSLYVNHQGSVMAMADGTTLTRTYRYSPYGETIAGSSADSTPFRFTGREKDSESIYYYRNRYYNTGTRQFLSQDPFGLTGGISRYGYALSNPVLLVDPLGLDGVVTIYSSGGAGSVGISGHSWISYTPTGGTTVTYGTWGNNPKGLGNGLHENLESGRPSDASRSLYLDDAAEAQLMKRINDYRKLGGDAWTLGSPCSGFARDVWQRGTGENLNSNFGPINNPTTLKNSIIKANGGVAHSTGAGPNTPSSASSGSSGRSSGSSLNSSGSSL